MKLLLNLSCDKVGVERCTMWQINYIISLVDDSESMTISMNDFVNNYWVLLNEIQKNKKVPKKEQKLNGGDFFRDSLHKIPEFENETKSKFMMLLGDQCRKAKKNLKRKLEFERLNEEFKNSSCELNTLNLDLVNNFSKEHSKVLISLENLINKAPPKVQQKEGDSPKLETKEDDPKVLKKKVGKLNLDNLALVKDKESSNNKTSTQLHDTSKLTESEIKQYQNESLILHEKHNIVNFKISAQNTFNNEPPTPKSTSAFSKDETNNFTKEESESKRKLNYFFKPSTSSRQNVNIKRNSALFQNAVVSKNSFLFSPDKVARKSRSPDKELKRQNTRNKNDEKLQLSMSAVENYIKY